MDIVTIVIRSVITINKVILYTTHCPRCEVLEKKLQEKGVIYEISEDTQFLIDNGFSEVPILKVDDEYLTFLTAVGWLDSIEVKK